MELDLERDGFAIIPDVLSADGRRELFGLLGPVHGAGHRGLLDMPEMITFARSESLLALVRPYLTAFPFPVRAIYFDKSPESNWLVPWHQDLTIAVKEEAEARGFGPWSVKDGVPHVQPPDALLGSMLTVRLHLDDADETNGALRYFRARTASDACRPRPSGITVPLRMKSSARSGSEGPC